MGGESIGREIFRANWVPTGWTFGDWKKDKMLHCKNKLFVNFTLCVWMLNCLPTYLEVLFYCPDSLSNHLYCLSSCLHCLVIQTVAFLGTLFACLDSVSLTVWPSTLLVWQSKLLLQLSRPPVWLNSLPACPIRYMQSENLNKNLKEKAFDFDFCFLGIKVVTFSFHLKSCKLSDFSFSNFSFPFGIDNRRGFSIRRNRPYSGISCEITSSSARSALIL